MSRVAACVVLLATQLVSPSAHADSAHVCATAAYDGQRLRDEGKLTVAYERFTACSDSSCPAVVVADCTKWLGELSARVPSIVLAARDAQGHDLLHVRVSIDGKAVTETLDGKAMSIDPGPHALRFDAEGRPSVDMQIIVREGEQTRLVSVVLASPPAPSAAAAPPAPSTPHPVRAESPSSGPSLVPGVVLGSFAVVALASFVYFGATGQSAKNDLSHSCAPTRSCDADDVAGARNKLIVADVSLGIAVVAGGIGAYLVARALGGRRSAEPRATIPSIRF